MPKWERKKGATFQNFKRPLFAKSEFVIFNSLSLLIYNKSIVQHEVSLATIEK